MTTALITGANNGLGYEAARRLIEAGHTVWMGARDAGCGQQAADALGGRFVHLDVTSDASVAAAADTVAAAGGLDYSSTTLASPVPTARPPNKRQPTP